MHYLEFIIVSAIIFPIVGQASGAGECRRFLGPRKLYCYDCDSWHDPYCGDPFNMTLPPENKPASRVCHGCCVKIIHKLQDGVVERVQRTCTENMIINYFMVDHVCMSEGKGRGKMCFCEENYCNGASLRGLPHPVAPIILLISSIAASMAFLSSWSFGLDSSSSSLSIQRISSSSSNRNGFVQACS